MSKDWLVEVIRNSQCSEIHDFAQAIREAYTKRLPKERDAVYSKYSYTAGFNACLKEIKQIVNE